MTTHLAITGTAGANDLTDQQTPDDVQSDGREWIEANMVAGPAGSLDCRTFLAAMGAASSIGIG